MPIKRGIKNNKGFYSFGDHGKKYTYIVGNKISRNIALNKAKKQGRVIKMNSAFHQKAKS